METPDDGYWPGTAAMDAGVTVGELGCSKCGCVLHGTISVTYCEFCGESFFEREENGRKEEV
jgi:uncharacterized Zn finger protein (UPF0148 family)